jgi:hypothetical protein
MERELWPRLCRIVREVEASIRQTSVRYQPGVILTVYFWAVLHDRPVSWACEPRNWDTVLRPPCLPSSATMSRRLRSLAVAALLRAIEARLRGAGPPDLLRVIDGKPLPVGGLSHDPDARCGHGAGKIAKGYKLDAIWGGRPVPEAWTVVPLNVNEAGPAPALIATAGSYGEGYLLGDNQDDSSALYDATAATGSRLVAPRKDPEAGISPGHYQAPDRLRAIDTLNRPFGQNLFALRGSVERCFGNATSFAGGLAPLPAWVRRSHRVHLWVWAKLLINGVRIVEKHGLVA